MVGVSVARQREMTATYTSLTKQRREVLGKGQALESLGQRQGEPHVELLPSSKNRSNHCKIINLSMDYEHQYGPPLAHQQPPGGIENIALPERTEAAAT